MKRTCPKCGKDLVYIRQLDHYSHVYDVMDIDDKYCHYNEGAK